MDKRFVFLAHRNHKIARDGESYSYTPLRGDGDAGCDAPDVIPAGASLLIARGVKVEKTDDGDFIWAGDIKPIVLP